jgi:hypothetical protein
VLYDKTVVATAALSCVLVVRARHVALSRFNGSNPHHRETATAI